MKPKLWMGFCLLFVLFIPKNVLANEQGNREIHAIPEPTWVFKAGMSKGKNHDRQDLGFILPEKTVLRVRQTNSQFTGKLTVRLLGNNSALEKTATVGSDWVEIQADYPLVPFVDTPYGSQAAQIEYEVVSEQKPTPLPIYTYQSNVQTFFTQWDASDAAYSLVQDQDFQMLAPKRDKEALRKLRDYATIDELIEHYRAVFAEYNQLAGLDGSTAENVAGQNRYFLRGDSNGPGGAYYGDKWASNSYGTVSIWLAKNGWAALHEIGHGYQAGFKNNGLYSGEVSNNLFAVQYQYQTLGKAADDLGWLFNYGKKTQLDASLVQLLKTSATPYNTGDLRKKLIFLTLLKEKGTDEGFIKMYQGYRAAANQPGFRAADYRFPDLMNQYYSAATKQDFTPAIERIGLSTDEKLAEKNRKNGYPAVAYLADVVPESELTRARALVDADRRITSDLELVQNKEIAALHLKGDLTVQFEAKDGKMLENQPVLLKEGAKVIQKATIQAGAVHFSDVPTGVYSLAFETAFATRHELAQKYVYVKEATNTAKIAVQDFAYSSLLNQTITFRGLGNYTAALLTTDLDKGNAQFQVKLVKPHSYYAGKTYFSIRVTDEKEQVKFEKTVQGTNAVKGNETFPLALGDKIEIYHAETRSRLKSAENILDLTQNQQNFVMTKWGLQNQSTALQQNAQFQLMEKVDDKMNDWILTDLSAEQRRTLLLAIATLDQPYQAQYQQEYQTMFGLSAE